MEAGPWGKLWKCHNVLFFLVRVFKEASGYQYGLCNLLSLCFYQEFGLGVCVCVIGQIIQSCQNGLEMDRVACIGDVSGVEIASERSNVSTSVCSQLVSLLPFLSVLDLG